MPLANAMAGTVVQIFRCSLAIIIIIIIILIIIAIAIATSGASTRATVASFYC